VHCCGMKMVHGSPKSRSKQELVSRSNVEASKLQTRRADGSMSSWASKRVLALVLHGAVKCD
jgi:hypothetical protein